MGEIRGKLDPEYLNQLDTEVVAEMVDKLLPDVMRVKRIGRTILVFVGQPAFGPCFDGTGYDFGKYPSDWLTELHGFRIRLKGVVEELNSTVRSYTIYGSDLKPLVGGLISNCDKTLILLNLVGKKFVNTLRNSGAYDPEDGDWGSWVEGDEDDEAGWYRLPHHEMFIPDYHPGMSDGEIEKEDRSIRDCFVKFVGGIQRDILTELKSAAENAIYVETLFDLIRELLDTTLNPLSPNSSIQEPPKKPIETPIKSPNPLNLSQMVILEGMVYHYDNGNDTLTVGTLHESLAKNPKFKNTAKTISNSMKPLADLKYVERPFENEDYIRLTEMGRSLFPRSS